MIDDEAPTPRMPDPVASLNALHAGYGVAGQYRLIDRLGVGGQGEVWSADDLVEGGRRALKFSLSVDDSDLQREAAIGKAIRDPNVCEFFGDVRVHDGLSFLAMEYVTGDNLAEYLATLQMTGSLFSPAVAARIAAQIANGLAAIHAEDYVHRDIKPQNVMLKKNGVVKITDFGLTVSAANVQPGAGTPLYMAPELLGFINPATKKSDVFAAGLVLCELLTGTRCRDGVTLEAIVNSANCHRPPSAIRTDIPPRLDEIVMWCLADDPDARPTARELFEACSRQAM